jgi:hypothetical protein
MSLRWKPSPNPLTLGRRVLEVINTDSCPVFPFAEGAILDLTRDSQTNPDVKHLCL